MPAAFPSNPAGADLGTVPAAAAKVVTEVVTHVEFVRGTPIPDPPAMRVVTAGRSDPVAFDADVDEFTWEVDPDTLAVRHARRCNVNLPKGATVRAVAPARDTAAVTRVIA